MQVTDALIEKLAALSMLRFDEAEKEIIREDLQKMIGFIDQLKELDATGVEPLLHLTPRTNVLRADEAGAMLTRDEALSNAARHDGEFFLVPKVIQKPE